MFDFLKTEKNLERLANIVYYGLIVVAICVVVGSFISLYTTFIG